MITIEQVKGLDIKGEAAVVANDQILIGKRIVGYCAHGANMPLCLIHRISEAEKHAILEAIAEQRDEHDCDRKVATSEVIIDDESAERDEETGQLIWTPPEYGKQE